MEKDLKETKENNKNCTQVPQSKQGSFIKGKKRRKRKNDNNCIPCLVSHREAPPNLLSHCNQKRKKYSCKLKRTLFVGARSSFFCFSVMFLMIIKKEEKEAKKRKKYFSCSNFVKPRNESRNRERKKNRDFQV